MSKRRPHSGKTQRATRRPAPKKRVRSKERLSVPEIKSGLNTFLEGTREFQRAHRDGMNALRQGDSAGIGDAIKRERDIIEQQREVIERNRTKTQPS